MGVLIEKGTKVSVFATLQHVRRHALVTDFHKVEHIAAASNKEELHNCIIQRYSFSGKQAHVARNEDEHIKSFKLCFEGDAYDAPVLRQCAAFYENLNTYRDMILRFGSYAEE